ncbi:phosphate acyltransferase PlsX [Haloimpatiens sp. FM7315]|uniref:phosphate acyltransferase PlsX n=1 Tax=Haloimpatiens sp. FM7315 TaxID=3298609 RepID=UPI00370AAB2C
MKIVIDGMGGDNAPNSVIEGCINAIKEYNSLEVIITGPQSIINEELCNYTYDKNRIKVVDAKEIISNNEHPVMAIRRKKDSSLARALKMVKDKEADAVISAGSTGAFMAGGLFIIGRIKGIDRPAIAPILPGKNGPSMLIDCGANAECKPINLLQFAYMGKVYFENIMKVNNPTVGLINIGTEEEKGNSLTKESHKLLKESSLNFVGNIEPREVISGDTNILVCDGFVGNTVLKTFEGAAFVILSTIKEGIMGSFLTKLGGFLLKPVFRDFKKKFDYKEYGGAAFLGVDGICIKAHGSSDAKAMKNAIGQAIKFYDNSIIDKIKSQIESETFEK